MDRRNSDLPVEVERDGVLEVGRQEFHERSIKGNVSEIVAVRDEQHRFRLVRQRRLAGQLIGSQLIIRRTLATVAAHRVVAQLAADVFLALINVHTEAAVLVELVTTATLALESDRFIVADLESPASRK